MVTPLDPELEAGMEGCLSVPGLRAAVRRWRRVRYAAFTPSGEPVVREVEGFHARVVQHECDHLDGMLFVDRVVDTSTLTTWESFETFHRDDGSDVHLPVHLPVHPTG